MDQKIIEVNEHLFFHFKLLISCCMTNQNFCCTLQSHCWTDVAHCAHSWICTEVHARLENSLPNCALAAFCTAVHLLKIGKPVCQACLLKNEVTVWQRCRKKETFLSSLSRLPEQHSKSACENNAVTKIALAPSWRERRCQCQQPSEKWIHVDSNGLIVQPWKVCQNSTHFQNQKLEMIHSSTIILEMQKKLWWSKRRTNLNSSQQSSQSWSLLWCVEFQSCFAMQFALSPLLETRSRGLQSTHSRAVN